MSSGRDELRFSISDTGIGIDSEQASASAALTSAASCAGSTGEAAGRLRIHADAVRDRRVQRARLLRQLRALAWAQRARRRFLSGRFGRSRQSAGHWRRQLLGECSQNEVSLCDLSMRIGGDAASDAHEFANYLWTPSAMSARTTCTPATTRSRASGSTTNRRSRALSTNGGMACGSSPPRWNSSV
jgi:hypothetical protein